MLNGVEDGLYTDTYTRMRGSYIPKGRERPDIDVAGVASAYQ